MSAVLNAHLRTHHVLFPVCYLGASVNSQLTFLHSPITHQSLNFPSITVNHSSAEFPSVIWESLTILVT